MSSICKPTKADWDILESFGITPANLSFDGSLDLRDTGIRPVWVEEVRTYKLYVLPHSTDFYVVAGCRFFKSLEAAKAHWGGEKYPNADRGKRYIAEIEKAVAAFREGNLNV